MLIIYHYNDVTMGEMASQVTSLTIVYSAVYMGADQRKHQSPASLAFVRGIHRGPVNSPHKWPITRKMFPWRHHGFNVFQNQGYLSDVKYRNMQVFAKKYKNQHDWRLLCPINNSCLGTDISWMALNYAGHYPWKYRSRLSCQIFPGAPFTNRVPPWI